MGDVQTLKDELGNVISSVDQTGVEILASLRMSTSYFQDGKATVTVLATNKHPKMRLKSAFAQLIEVPDATGTTITVKVRNAGGGADMTNVLTFTQGTEGVADVKAFTVNAINHTVTKGQAVEIITAGTTTIAGEVVVHLEWIGVA